MSIPKHLESKDPGGLPLEALETLEAQLTANIKDFEVNLSFAAEEFQREVEELNSVYETVNSLQN